MRFLEHEYNARSGVGNTALYNAWRKYGVPELKILAILENDLLADTEIKAISTFNTMLPFGYNSTSGGEVSPALFDNVRKKMSDAHKTRWTQDRRDSYSDATKKQWQEDGAKEKLKASMKKTWSTSAMREKLSESQKKRWESPEIRARLIEAAKLQWANPNRLRASTEIMSTRGRNAKVSTRNTSGFKGVSFHKKDKMWRARITINKKVHWLGNFETPELAAKAYNEAKGKFSITN